MSDFVDFSRDTSTGEEAGCGCFIHLSEYYQEGIATEAAVNYADNAKDKTVLNSLLGGSFSLDESNGTKGLLIK